MIIGYIRVSTGKQHPENQQDEITRYAKENNMVVDRWVTEIVSGKKEVKGRKLGRTISMMKRGDTLIVSEVSRLSRNLTDIMTIMGKCLKKGVNIYTTKERYRFDDSINSKILCFAFGLVAEIERNLISLRTKEALAMRRSEGVVLGRPTGSCTKQQILHDNEAEVLRMLEAGNSVRSICRHFKVSKDTWYRYRRQKNPDTCP
jgi:DNA invertase Pin-like site-specific DNA recombinase